MYKTCSTTVYQVYKYTTESFKSVNKVLRKALCLHSVWTLFTLCMGETEVLYRCFSIDSHAGGIRETEDDATGGGLFLFWQFRKNGYLGDRYF